MEVFAWIVVFLCGPGVSILIVFIILWWNYRHEGSFGAGAKQAWYDFVHLVLGSLYYFFGCKCKTCGRMYLTQRRAKNCCKNGPKKRIDGGYTEEFMGAWIQNNIRNQDKR